MTASKAKRGSLVGHQNRLRRTPALRVRSRGVRPHVCDHKHGAGWQCGLNQAPRCRHRARLFSHVEQNHHRFVAIQRPCPHLCRGRVAHSHRRLAERVLVDCEQRCVAQHLERCRRHVGQVLRTRERNPKMTSASVHVNSAPQAESVTAHSKFLPRTTSRVAHRSGRTRWMQERRV